MLVILNNVKIIQLLQFKYVYKMYDKIKTDKLKINISRFFV